MRHPVAGGPLRHNCVSLERVDRLIMETGQSQGEDDNMENRGTTKHVSGDEQRRSANYSSLTKPEGDKQLSSNPPLLRKPLGLCPPLCSFIIQNNTTIICRKAVHFFPCLQLYSAHCLQEINTALGRKQM